MCNPVAFTIASALITAYGQKKQADYQGDVADYNQKVEVQKADAATQAGVSAEMQQRAKVRQIIGTQTASEGASGAMVNSGSFGDVTADTALSGALDAQTIRLNAARQVWGINAQATSDQMQGQMARASGRMAVAGTLLNGAAKSYGYSVNWGK